MIYILLVISVIINTYALFLSTKSSDKFIYYFMFSIVSTNLLISPLSEDINGIMFVFRLLFLLMLLVYSRNLLLKWHKYLLFLLFYFFLVLFLHMDAGAIGSFIHYITMFLLAYACYKKIDLSRVDARVNTLFSYLVLFLVFYLTFTTTTGYGRVMYSEAYNVGAFGSQRITLLSYFIVFGFISMINTKKINAKNILVLLIGLSILFLIMKRSTLIILFIGIISFVIYNKGGYGHKIKGLGALLVIVFCIILVFGSEIQNRIQERADRYEVSLEMVESENRFMEYLVFPEYISDSDISTLVLGNGFISTHSYRYDYLGFRDRSIHVGYIKLVYHVGILGLVLIGFPIMVIVIRLLQNRPNFMIYNRNSILSYGFASTIMLIANLFVDDALADYTAYAIVIFIAISFKVTKMNRNGY